MENTEKKVWVYTTGSGSSWHKPNYQNFMFINEGKPTTQEEADAELWESRCDDCNAEGDMEMCDNCQGEGCEDCEFEGGWYEEWADVVERNTYCYMEEYNPDKHFRVKSDRPEHLLWKANNTVDIHSSRVERLESTVERLTRELEEAQRELGLENVQLAAAKLNLKQVEESLND